MRKVLLRFVFDNLWQWQAVGNELHVGAAWLMLLWVAIVGVVFGMMYATSRKASESAMSAGFWLIVPAALGAAWRSIPGQGACRDAVSDESCE